MNAEPMSLGLAAWICRPDKHAFARRDPLPLPDEPEPERCPRCDHLMADPARCDHCGRKPE